MLKKMIKECIALTDRIMVDHYHADSEILKQHIDDNCLWIGSCDSEYYIGRNEIIKVLDQWRGDLPMINLVSKEFKCVTHDRNSCTVVGRYVGITDADCSELFSDRQRATFCWKVINEELRIMHMHISNPLQNLQKEEVFPHKIGKYSKRYMKMLINKEIRSMGSICVKGQDNINHKILIGKIIYLEAFDKETLIHTTDGDIYAKQQLSSLGDLLEREQPGLVIRVHKSFSANRYYAESMGRYELKLYGGHSIPVSRSGYQEIRERLLMRETDDERET